VIYIFDEDASKESLKIRGENHKYLFKVRRHIPGDKIGFRDPNNSDILYTYEVKTLTPKDAILELVDSQEEIIKSDKDLHIGWCIIDSKSIEKVLPSLNEIGVSKITFISCDRSQKNFKMDFERFDRILLSSSSQCGRSKKMEFDTSSSLKEFIKENPEAVAFDFCDNYLIDSDQVSCVIIGCEGGFSESERETLKETKRVRLKTPMVLRSESAAVAISSKLLL
jgi:16S rRNA (uracil1498-N3)-methyltransferase